jgi:hypothetical protein
MNVRKCLSCLENFFLTGPRRLINMRHGFRADEARNNEHA